MIRRIENPQEGSGFDTLHTFDGWRVAFITHAEQYGEPRVLKRHLYTDEAFVLSCGDAVMYTVEDGELVGIPMSSGALYNVEKGTWHHLKVSPDALLVVIENSDTAGDGTEVMALRRDDAAEKTIKKGDN